jgi:hypothetical protein
MAEHTLQRLVSGIITGVLIAVGSLLIARFLSWLGFRW